MSFVLALVALAGSLLFQASLGQGLPTAGRYVDAMLFPVVYYALARTQRSAMLVGCASGLLQDAWFQAGAFGVHGFSRTLLGWALGGLGARFDLNHFWGQLLGGATMFVGDRAIEIGLLLLLDQSVAPPTATELLLGAMVNGLLVPAVFTVVQRGMRRERARRPVRRRA